MSSKLNKMLPERGNNSNSPAPVNNPNTFFGSVFGELNPGESTNIELKKNRNGSATLKCQDQGKTVVARPSGKNVGYSYTPKKK